MEINSAARRRVAGGCGGRSFFNPHHRTVVDNTNSGRSFLPFQHSAAASTSFSGTDHCRRWQNQPKPSPPKPVQFVSSSSDVKATPESTPAVKRSGDDATKIGQFELHTRGIGSRLMAKMGYIPGKGLGKDGQGISAPVAPEYQHDKMGVGFLASASWPSSKSATDAAIWPSWDSAKKKKTIASSTPVTANPWEVGTSKTREAGECSNREAAPPTEKAAILGQTEHIPIGQNDSRCKRNRAARAQKEKQSPAAGKKRQEYAMNAIADAIEGANKQQSSGNLTLNSLMDMFGDLKKRFTEEFETCELSSVAANLAYPLLVEVFWGWKPEAEELLQGLELMSSWKDLLLSQRDCLDDASVYGNLVRDVVLPVVREWGANSWNATDPQPMIAFLELWELLLPRAVRELILEEVVMSKLLLAVESWDPRVEMTPIHVWVLPWSALLDTRLDSLYETIRVKMGRVLDSWNPSDRSAFDLLSPWKHVFDSASWEKMMMKYIIPKLKSALKKNKQKLEDQFNWVMRWDSVMSTEQIVALLEDRFFSNWLRALELWLRNSGHDLREVSKWFESWKTQFSSVLLTDERIQVLLSTALSRIDQEKEKEAIYMWD